MTTAAGSLSTALVGLETILADSDSFRARTGAGNAKAAKTHIYFGTQDLRPMHAPSRPAAILALGGAALVQFAGGPEIFLGNNGQIVLLLIDDTREPDPKAAYLDFLNFTGQVLDDINDLSGEDYDDGAGPGTAVYWSFTAAEILLEPTRSDIDLSPAEDYQLAAFGFSYGIE